MSEQRMRKLMAVFGITCSLTGAGFGLFNHNAYAVLFLAIAVLNLLIIRRAWP